jgi:chemotaxis protein methyltransferase CheR
MSFKESGFVTNAVIDTSLLTIGRAEFRLFRELLHQHSGIWLRDGKEVMLASRLARRLRDHGMSSFAEYYEYVKGCQDNGQELGELLNCVTTNKTAFFRERHHFDFLSQVVVPELVAGMHAPTAGNGRDEVARPMKMPIRIWSAACSTGEEPYSIAITLLESPVCSRYVSGLDIHIVASDLDTTVLEKAVRGVYGEEELEGINPAIQKKYFLRGTDGMLGKIKVKKPVTDLVDFQRLNLMDRVWPLSTPFDAVFFRNALIYFQRDIQDLFLRRIVRHMKPGGYLFLGHSEHVPWLQSILEPLEKTVHRVRTSIK